MSELSVGDREGPEGCRAQITHVIFDCDGLLLGELAYMAVLPYLCTAVQGVTTPIQPQSQLQLCTLTPITICKKRRGR